MHAKSDSVQSISYTMCCVVSAMYHEFECMDNEYFQLDEGATNTTVYISISATSQCLIMHNIYNIITYKCNAHSLVMYGTYL